MIAQAVGASKRDVVVRWRELCDAAREVDLPGLEGLFDEGAAAAAASTPKGRYNHHHDHHEHSNNATQPSPQAQANASAASTPKDGHRHHHHHHRDNNDNAPSTPQPSPQQAEAKDAAAAEVRVDRAALEDDAAHKSLHPDGVWTVADLEVLAEVEQQYRRLKWMHVQAGFYNMTGRMVGAEVIKAKFEEG